MSFKYTKKEISNGVITGDFLHVIGDRNFILGDNCIVEGNYNQVIGYFTKFKGEHNSSKYPKINTKKK